MYGESSKSKQQSHSSSRSSTSSRRSYRQSRQPSVVDWAEPIGSSSQATQYPIDPSSGESGNKLSPVDEYQPTIESSQGQSGQLAIDLSEAQIGSSSQPAHRQLLELHGEEELKNSPPDSLKNEYGNFRVERGVRVGPALPERDSFGRAHSTKIEMTPSWRTRESSTGYTKGSEIDLVQVVRSGTGDNWRTRAEDHGWKAGTDDSGQAIDSEGKPRFFHRAELTEQDTGTGWRVDQSLYDSPFYGETHNSSMARHHSMKESETVQLRDDPTIVEPGFHFDAMTTAMEKKTGKEFGTVEWGFRVGKNERGENWLDSRTPTFLENNLKLEGTDGEEARERDRGRRAAYRRWNQAAPGKEQENIRQQEMRPTEYRQEPKRVTRIPGID